MNYQIPLGPGPRFKPTGPDSRFQGYGRHEFMIRYLPLAVKRLAAGRESGWNSLGRSAALFATIASMRMWLKSWIHLLEIIGLAVVEQKKTNAILATIAAQMADADSSVKAQNDLLMRISCLTK